MTPLVAGVDDIISHVSSAVCTVDVLEKRHLCVFCVLRWFVSGTEAIREISLLKELQHPNIVRPCPVSVLLFLLQTKTRFPTLPVERLCDVIHTERKLTLVPDAQGCHFPFKLSCCAEPRHSKFAAEV